MKTWIQSYTGRQVFPLDLKPEQVTLEDIAHALSLKTRFTGHCRELYSVAEHCVRGSRAIAPAFALPFLLHEVSEVYLPDIAAPVKPFVRVQMSDETVGPYLIDWSDLEREHAEVILQALGLSSLLPLLHSPEVKSMDQRMLATEARDLMGPPPEPWGLTAEPLTMACWPEGIMPWTPIEAEKEFLFRFQELTTP